MNSDVPYSAKREDLYYPGRAEDFFGSGVPKSEAALCAELARLAYCRQEPGFSFDQARIRGILQGVGFEGCEFCESEGEKLGRGIHCFLAVREDGEREKGLAILSFRGTDKDDPTDLGDDADAILTTWERGGRVHQGFAKALSEVRQDLDVVLKPIKQRLLLTGHSLGAALATLVASILPPHSLFTFGSPRVGDHDFVASLNGVQGNRYVNCRDIVTRIPPAILGYSHFGKPHYIDRNHQVTFNPSSAFMAEDGVLAEAEYLAKYAWRDGNVGLRDLADHAPMNYVMPLSADPS